jgi:putative spermidine/putrescine transport system permease protein
VVTLPFVLVTAMAGLRSVDPNLETAAMVMGAGRLTVLRRITLPLLTPAIVTGGLFAFLISFDEVVISYYVTNVRTQTLPVKMYSTIHWEISPVLAAISTLLTVLSLAVCLAGALLQKER